MTKAEELRRYIEDRDMLENQIEADNEIMKQIEADIPFDYEDVQEWNDAWDEVNAASNQVEDLNRHIEELQNMDV